MWKLSETKFPTRGHILFGGIIALIPIINIIILAFTIGFYIFGRTEQDIVLKKNKFTKYWFDVDE